MSSQQEQQYPLVRINPQPVDSKRTPVVIDISQPVVAQTNVNSSAGPVFTIDIKLSTVIDSARQIRLSTEVNGLYSGPSFADLITAEKIQGLLKVAYDRLFGTVPLNA